MTVASVAFFVLLGQVPSADPVDLIQQLGASRYAEREAATTALERIGRRALPALRLAREQRDPEVRSRAATLLARIEGSLLTQPTLISFNFRDAGLTDVVQSFSEQSGIKIMLQPENSPIWRNKKVTIEESEPLPFWKAVDRLCDAAQLQYTFGARAFPVGREPTFPLIPGAVRPALPVSDFGPFRVSIVSLHYSRDVTFPPSPQGPRNPQEGGAAHRSSAMISEQFKADMQVAAEPRLSVIQNAPLRISEAVDDRGNSLVIPMSNSVDVRRSGYFGFPTGSVVQFQAAMLHPAGAGTMIKKLKGVVPVLVSTRKPNPLVVTLTGATGRTFQNDDVALTVHELRTQPNNRPPTIEVTIRPSAGNSSASAAGIGGGDMVAARPDSHQQQLEITDNQGHLIPWYQSNFDAEAGRLTISLTSPEQAAVLGELHYYSLVRAATEVPFEFSDITMP